MSDEATAWFDQFPALQEGAEWNNDQWCPRHWAPCPILGANGLGASVEMMGVFFNEMRPVGADTPYSMNESMHNMGRVCCTLGDDRMFEIWGHWPPVEPTDSAGGIRT